MNREEFLKQFREALEGKVSEQVISENTAYYGNYINNQINSGKSESEVLQELGDPRLLAKTIEESSRFSGGREGAQRSAYSSAGYEQNSYGENESPMRGKVTTIPAWVVALIALIVIAFLITAVFHVFVFFLPVIIAGLVAMFVYRVLRSILK